MAGLVSFGPAHCGKPAREVGGGVYAEVEVVREWIWKTTNGCNERTCHRGSCIRIHDLHPQLQEMLGSDIF